MDTIHGGAPAHCVLCVRPAPEVNKNTRDLNDAERSVLQACLGLIDVNEGAAKGLAVVQATDVEKACDILHMDVDGTWKSDQGVQFVALRFRNMKPKGLVPNSGSAANAPSPVVPAAAKPSVPAAKPSSVPNVVPKPSVPAAKPSVPAAKPGSVPNVAPKPSAPATKPSAPPARKAPGIRVVEPFRPHAPRPFVEMLKPRRLPSVLVSVEAYKRMLCYVDYAEQEVGWLGTVRQLENGDFLIDMVYLVDQTVGPVTVDLSQNGQSALQVEFKQKHGFARSIEMGDALKFWGHSHVNMAVHPSPRDDETMLTKGNDGVDWYIRGIFNKKGQAKFDLYRFDLCYRILDLPWKVIDARSNAVLMAHEAQGKPANTTSPAASGKCEVVAVFKQSNIFYNLPESMRPSDELRLEVIREFNAKVTPRDQ